MPWSAALHAALKLITSSFIIKFCGNEKLREAQHSRAREARKDLPIPAVAHAENARDELASVTAIHVKPDTADKI
jgi:hypothetical protein